MKTPEQVRLDVDHSNTDPSLQSNPLSGRDSQNGEVRNFRMYDLSDIWQPPVDCRILLQAFCGIIDTHRFAIRHAMQSLKAHCLKKQLYDALIVAQFVAQNARLADHAIPAIGPLGLSYTNPDPDVLLRKLAIALIVSGCDQVETRLMANVSKGSFDGLCVAEMLAIAETVLEENGVRPENRRNGKTARQWRAIEYRLAYYKKRAELRDAVGRRAGEGIRSQIRPLRSRAKVETSRAAA